MSKRELQSLLWHQVCDDLQMEDIFAEDVLLSWETHSTISSNAWSKISSTPKFKTNLKPAEVGISIKSKDPAKKFKKTGNISVQTFQTYDWNSLVETIASFHLFQCLQFNILKILASLHLFQCLQFNILKVFAYFHLLQCLQFNILKVLASFYLFQCLQFNILNKNIVLF